ncbi:hypothetical protein CENSYa_2053 [Cenarchaeum symbiosum A]|uniref:Uncharacterized protein n=1 Tax=Cenarchaeum symbiosum (strain A) TaxID=414004 RepID=A0RZ89_CENSY|nr:hypothetical protein CENSYa_2053 [Cenarchaeum symbiosum A]
MPCLKPYRSSDPPSRMKKRKAAHKARESGLKTRDILGIDLPPKPGDEADHRLPVRHVLIAVLMRIKGRMSREDLGELLGNGAALWYTNLILQSGSKMPDHPAIAEETNRGAGGITHTRELFLECLSVPLAGGGASHKKVLIVADADSRIIEAGKARDGSTPDIEMARIHLAGDSHLASICAARPGEDPCIITAGPGFEGLGDELPGTVVHTCGAAESDGASAAEMAPIQKAMNRLQDYAILTEPFDETSHDLDVTVQYMVNTANTSIGQEWDGKEDYDEVPRDIDAAMQGLFAASGRLPPGHSRTQDLAPVEPVKDGGGPAGQLSDPYDALNRKALEIMDGRGMLELLNLEPGDDGAVLLYGREPPMGGGRVPSTGGTVLAAIMRLRGITTDDAVGRLYGMDKGSTSKEIRAGMNTLYNMMTWKPESMMKELKRARPHRITKIITGNWLYLGCLAVPVIPRDKQDRRGGTPRKAMVIADRTGQVIGLGKSRHGGSDAEMAKEYLEGNGRRLAQLLRSRAEDGWAVVAGGSFEGLAGMLPGITVLNVQDIRDDPGFSGIWGIPYDASGRRTYLMERTMNMFGDYGILEQYDEDWYDLDRTLQVVSGLVNARAVFMRSALDML